MAVLQSTNVQGTLCVNGVAVGGGKDIKFCCFTASTTFTPSQDLVDGGGYIETSIAGGGGGGGGIRVESTTQQVCIYGGGGGGGEVITNSKLLTSTDACTITIGAGGVAGVVNCATSTCEDCVVSTAGGNSSALGYTAYGGGGGGSIGCSDTLSICYETNLAGGPSGGRGWAVCNATPNCQNINTRFLKYTRGVGGTSTFDEKNVSNVDLYNYNFQTATTSTFQNTLHQPGCIHSIKVSGSLCGKEIYTSRTTPAGLGRATTIIGGLNVGAGGKSLCNTDYMDCAIEDGGVSSTYAGGGHGGGFWCGLTAQCDGFAGTNGIVVLRWEE